MNICPKKVGWFGNGLVDHAFVRHNLTLCQLFLLLGCLSLFGIHHFCSFVEISQWIIRFMKSHIIMHLTVKIDCTRHAHNHFHISHSINVSLVFQDLDRQCCGYCKGRFELVTKKAASNTENVPAATPKKPNPFAEFVKENYKNIRTPGSSHKETMKTLSQQFAKTKIN